MCIKVERWFCCSVSAGSISENQRAECRKQTAPEEHQLIPDEEIQALCLPRYEGFEYVRHMVVSWIRCATWNNQACIDPLTPVHVRSLAFKIPCSNCSCYGKCLSERSQAYQVHDGLRCPPGLGDEPTQMALRSMAAKALECVLRSEASRYHHLTGTRHFRMSENFTEEGIVHDRPLRLTAPLMFPMFCTDPSHMIRLRTTACECRNKEFSEANNRLRCIYRHSAQALFGNLGGDLISVIGRRGARHRKDFDRMLRSYQRECGPKIMLMSQEWLANSTEQHDQQEQRTKVLQEYLARCYHKLLNVALGALSYEQLCGRLYNIHDRRTEDIITRRFEFAKAVSVMISYDQGIQEGLYPHLCYYLCRMLLPWTDENTDINELNHWRIKNEDLTVIQDFVSGIDLVGKGELEHIANGYQRDEALQSRLHGVSEELVANLKAAHTVFDFNPPSLRTCGQVSRPSDADRCFVCLEEFPPQAVGIPKQWEKLRMPCCNVLIHEACLRGFLASHPEFHQQPRCPMCRADLREKHAWLKLTDSFCLFRDSPTYKPLEGFITRDEPHGMEEVSSADDTENNEGEAEDDDRDNDRARIEDDAFGIGEDEPGRDNQGAWFVHHQHAGEDSMDLD